MRHLTYILLIFVLLFSSRLEAQNLYKTPSGRRYHLASCRMVRNVSAKISPEQIKQLGLTPCKICHPPAPANVHTSTKRSKAVGSSPQSVRCKGKNQAWHAMQTPHAYCKRVLFSASKSV